MSEIITEEKIAENGKESVVNDSAVNDSAVQDSAEKDSASKEYSENDLTIGTSGDGVFGATVGKSSSIRSNLFVCM